MGVVWTDASRAARGGTELACRALEERVDPGLLDQFQIVPSRMTGVELDPEKIRLFWAHDLPNDPAAAEAVGDGRWRRFHRCVFVSHHQMQEYVALHSIPWSRCVVMQNAIVPVPRHEKPAGPVRIVYTPTPHRGLDVLLAAFDSLSREDPDVVLDVYSSFSLYGWEDRDEQFRPLFDFCDRHEKIERHGTVSNDEVRAALARSHVFAYPSTWPETSCMCLMEAMSADLVCAHSNLGALPETAAGWTLMYQYDEDKSRHSEKFLTVLRVAVDAARRHRESSREPSPQKAYADMIYDWELRAEQWTAFMRSLLDEPRQVEPSGPDFVYKVG